MQLGFLLVLMHVKNKLYFAILHLNLCSKILLRKVLRNNALQIMYKTSRFMMLEYILVYAFSMTL